MGQAPLKQSNFERRQKNKGLLINGEEASLESIRKSPLPYTSTIPKEEEATINPANNLETYLDLLDTSNHLKYEVDLLPPDLINKLG
jgi:hypothetical protein